MTATAHARLLDPNDLSDPSGGFVTVRRLPILDAHDSKEKGDVSADLLRLLARNTNARVARGEHVALTCGHLQRKTSMIVLHPNGMKTVHPGAREDEQPPVWGWVSNFAVGDYNNAPCLFADLHVRKEHASKLGDYPWRSCERLESTDGNKSAEVIDRVAILRSAPERPLGVVHQYGRDQSSFVNRSGLRVIHYERECGHCAAVSGPTPSQRKRVNQLIDQENIRRIAYQAAIDACLDLDRFKDQIEGLEQLRRQGITIDDATIDRISALPEDEYAREYHNVRTHYARSGQRTHGRAIGSTASEHDIMMRSVDYASKHKCGYAKAKEAVLAGQS